MSQHPRPAVSVVIPCHNYGDYLPQAVHSVVAQTFQDWEIVIVDDGSTDDTASVARSLIAANADRRIRLLRQTKGGVSAARNAGIADSVGRYILPLDSDDVIAPSMLDKTVAVLDCHPEIAIASTDVFVFTDDDLPPQPMPLPAYSRELLLQRLIMFYCSLYRREVWVAVGGYNESMSAGEDWDFWIGCAERNFDAHHIHEALFGARNKDTGLHLEAAENDLAIRARIVLNHPSLFKPITRAWARALLDLDEAECRHDARVPDEIMTRAAEMGLFLQSVMKLQRTARLQHQMIQHYEKQLASRSDTGQATSPSGSLEAAHR